MAYTLTQARKLAQDIFKRKHDSGMIPYMEHLEAVSSALEAFDEDLQVVGMLHSILEHTDWTQETLLIEGLPDKSIETIVALTHERLQYPEARYFRQVRDNEDATLVKIACTAHRNRADRLISLPPFYRSKYMLNLGYAQRHLWTTAYKQDVRDILEALNPPLLTLFNSLD